VQAFLKVQLNQQIHWLDRRGQSQNALADAREEMLDHGSCIEIDSASPTLLKLSGVNINSGIVFSPDLEDYPNQAVRKKTEELSRTISLGRSSQDGRPVEAQRMHFHISINALAANASGWGDIQFARGLIRAFHDLGCSAQILFRHEVPMRVAQDDVVLRIAGPFVEEPVIGYPNILWVISPPNIMPPPLLKRYQTVVLASEHLAAQIRRHGVDARVLQQVSDPEHFHPGKRASGSPLLQIVFVGSNAERAPRPSVQKVAGAGLDLHVWGRGWEGIIPPHMWRGERLSYEELATVYASARIVLNDHMPPMAEWGMMSNRSFDAIACGAVVVSEPIAAFNAPDLPELLQFPLDANLVPRLRQLLDTPPDTMQTRLDRNRRIAANHSFETAADHFMQLAGSMLDARSYALPAFQPRSTDHASRIRLTAPEAQGDDQRAAMVKSAQQISKIFRALEARQCEGFDAPPIVRQSEQGVLHALTYDLRCAQALALQDKPHVGPKEIAILERARRVLDIGLVPAVNLSSSDRNLTNYMLDKPLFTHSPVNFNADRLKGHVALWPRKQVAPVKRPIGVFLHLYYHELAEEFARVLEKIPLEFSVYISTDSAQKASRIQEVFRDADIRVFPNRGRDIYPKFFGFIEEYDRHDIVLHLHGKKSPHSHKLDKWLEHNLACLLSSPAEINRVLSFFTSIPELGLVAPLVFPSVLGAAHWGANADIARELAHRMGWPDDLPGNDRLRFPVGSMFWARTEVLRPIIELGLGPQHFPVENGQVDATTAHAIERLVGVCCERGGFRYLSVAPKGSMLFKKFQTTLRTNGELRKFLEERHDFAIEG
jgi:hypothetical protein